MGTVPDDELDVLGIGAAATLIDDERSLGELFEPNLKVTVGSFAHARPSDRDSHRVLEDGLGGNGDDRGLRERRERLCGNTIERYTALAETVIATRDRFDPQSRWQGSAGRRDLEGGDAGRWR